MSSILETFYILFESNADKVKKGSEDAKHSTDDLEDSLKRGDRAGAELGQHLVSVFKEVGAAFGAAFAVHHIAEEVGEVAELNDMLGKLAKSYDVQIEDLGAWGQAVDRSGGSVEGLYGSLSSLNRGMADMAAKGTSRLLPFFKDLKIEMLDTHKKVRPIFDLMLDISGAFEKMTKQESFGFGEKLGLDTGTLMLLQSGRRAVQDLIDRQKMLGTATQEDADKAEKFNDQWDDTKQIFRGVYTAIGSYILPGLTSILKIFERTIVFLREHKDVVTGFFIGIAGIIGAVYMPAVIEAAIATWAFLAPWLAIPIAIIAVAAAFALAYDDVKAFLSGNNSIIGELSKKWPWIGEMVKGIVNYFVWGLGVLEAFGNLGVAVARLIGAAFMAFFDWLVNSDGMGFGKVGKAIGSFFHSVGKMIGDLIGKIPGIGTAFKVVGMILDAWGKAFGAMWDWIIDKIKNAAGWINAGAKLITGIAAALGGPAAPASAAPPPKPPAAQHSEAIIKAVRGAQGAIRTADSTPIAAQTSNSIRNAHTVNKNVTIQTGPVTVHTQATDGKAVSKDIAAHLQNEMRQAVSHFDDGVDG